MALHIFDVDYTIVRCSTVREFLPIALRDGAIGPSVFLHLPRLILAYLSGAAGPGVSARTYPFIRDVPMDRLEDIAETVFRERVLPRLDRGVEKLINDLSASGEDLAIASASFAFLLAPLARRLGIADVVACELETAGGRTTGRLAGIAPFAEGKLARVRTFLAAKGISEADCVFYTDSPHDAPLLRAVGRAVAVNPDPRLGRLARRMGWEILTTPKVGKERVRG